jgi:hypothetical protein
MAIRGSCVKFRYKAGFFFDDGRVREIAPANKGSTFELFEDLKDPGKVSGNDEREKQKGSGIETRFLNAG